MRTAIGSDTWLLNEIKGARISDRLILFGIKYFYLASRLLFTKTKVKSTNCRKSYPSYNTFLYGAIDRLRLSDYLLLLFESPSCGYRFCCTITRKVRNHLIHDVYSSMTSHEVEILKFFDPKEGDTFVDVGAAFGRYTLPASMKVGTTGKVISIEPNYETFRLLCRNIFYNKLHNVFAFHVAAYSKEETLNLYSNYTVISDRAVKYTKEFVRVKASTLDKILEELGIIEANWMKIDVEGAELEVLKGSKYVLTNSKDLSILIEIHNISLKGSLYQAVIDYLLPYGFKIEHEWTHENGEKHILARKQCAIN